MPSLVQFLPFFFLISFSVSHGPSLPKAIILPINKDPSTFQYVTQVYMGANHLVPIKLVVNLGGSFLWADSGLSSSQKLVPCNSLKCSMAKPIGCANFAGFDNEKICALKSENPFTKLAATEELAEDLLAVEFIDELKTSSIASIHQFLFSCASTTTLLQGLARGAKGMLGLGNSRIALPSQLSDTFGFQRKFAICLSSTNGAIISGESPYLSLLGHDVSRSMLYTPLISPKDGVSEEYYINVKSIKINGKKLSLNTSLFTMDGEGHGGTKISTISPFATMKSLIYKTFVESYERLSISMELIKVEPIAPFGLCFSTKVGGPNVPTIDLVLQSEMVKWRIYGRNSMVKVSDNVMCLGFLDGGVNQKASIVIGGHQLEDNLLEFNLGTSMLGFTSSLSMAETSCSDFMLSKDSAFDS